MKITGVSVARLVVVVSVLAGAGTAAALSGAGIYLAVLPACLTLLAALVHEVKSSLQGSASGLALTARGWCTLSVVCAVLPLYYLYAQALLPVASRSDLSNFQGRVAVFTASVVSKREVADDIVQVTLVPHLMSFPARRRLSGRTLLTIKREELLGDLGGEPEVGSSLLLKARVYGPSRRRNPWEYDQSEQLRRRHLYSIVRLLKSTDHKGDRLSGSGCLQSALSYNLKKREDVPLQSSALASLEAVGLEKRSLLVCHHRQYLGKDTGDLLTSIVLGDKAVSMSETIASRFRDVGLSHLLAASGFNMTIVIATTFFVGRLLCPSLLVNNAVCFFAILSYITLSGLSPSILRAALMSSMLLAARSFSARVSIPAVLALAFLVTITCDPCSILDIGMQLSYSATLGIIFGASPCASILRGRTDKRWRKWLAEAIAVVAVAEASVFPIQLYHFWQVGLLFLPANLIVSPLITPITILGFFSSLLIIAGSGAGSLSCLFWALARAIDSVTWLPLSFMLFVVEKMASVESARVNLGMPQGPAIWLYYGALFILILAVRARRRLWLAVLLYGLSCLALIYRPPIAAVTIAPFSDRTVLLDGVRHAAVIRLPAYPKVSIETSGASNNVWCERDAQRFLSYMAARVEGSVSGNARDKGAIVVERQRSDGRQLRSVSCRVSGVSVQLLDLDLGSISEANGHLGFPVSSTAEICVVRSAGAKTPSLQNRHALCALARRLHGALLLVVFEQKRFSAGYRGGATPGARSFRVGGRAVDLLVPAGMGVAVFNGGASRTCDGESRY